MRRSHSQAEVFLKLLENAFNVYAAALKIPESVCVQKLDFSGIEPEIRQFEERFGKRILVKCNELSFNLQSCVAENEEGPTTNVIHNASAYIFDSFDSGNMESIIVICFLSAHGRWSLSSSHCPCLIFRTVGRSQQISM